ncbi:hypothetical protein JW949_03725 [Candidatus Woesearchaeota archaeon]|nr:hypothetical protein [Candidatus Woesearchaeota archaeon]
MNIRFEKSKPLEIALMGEEKYIKRIKRGRFRFNKNNLAGIINDLKGKEITEGNKEREKCVKTGKMDFYYSITLKNGKDNNYSLRFRFDKPFKSVIEYEELSINKNHKRSKKEKHENLELKVSNI